MTYNEYSDFILVLLQRDLAKLEPTIGPYQPISTAPDDEIPKELLLFSDKLDIGYFHKGNLLNEWDSQFGNFTGDEFEPAAWRPLTKESRYVIEEYERRRQAGLVVALVEHMKTREEVGDGNKQ